MNTVAQMTSSNAAATAVRHERCRRVSGLLRLLYCDACCCPRDRHVSTKSGQQKKDELPHSAADQP
jgi:hypothetical protein